MAQKVVVHRVVVVVAGASAAGCGYDHRVEFYDSTEFLVDSVTDFTGLRAS
jgi:hypothetical protein